MPGDISILILAAGASSRMKKPKQLLPWRNSTLIEHIVNIATSLSTNTYVILGAHKERIRERLSDKNINIVDHLNWEEGMGSSIAAGVRDILKAEQPAGLLILLCDQPLIDRAYLKEMIDQFRQTGKGIIGTKYPTKIGVPALFGPNYFQDLVQLEGDRGASSIITTNSDDCLALSANGKESDIDTLDDYTAIRP